MPELELAAGRTDEIGRAAHQQSLVLDEALVDSWIGRLSDQGPAKRTDEKTANRKDDAADQQAQQAHWAC